MNRRNRRNNQAKLEITWKEVKEEITLKLKALREVEEIQKSLKEQELPADPEVDKLVLKYTNRLKVLQNRASQLVVQHESLTHDGIRNKVNGQNLIEALKQLKTNGNNQSTASPRNG